MQKMKINVKTLTMEIMGAIEDLFVAQVVEIEQGIELRFLNGQKFSIRVKEE